MNYTFEKNKLKSYLGEELYKHLKNHNLIIAGGTITSLFTGNEINDIDVYGTSNEGIYEFAKKFIDDGSWIVSHTNKATQFTYDEKMVQLIHYKDFPTVESLFNSFDYTVCMGAFNFGTEEFILHPDFLKHNSQRIIKFNSGTDYPIVSALRIQKYENKGYKISKPEYIRIVMSCMSLNITSYEELKDHLGGMYGISYDLLFDDVKDEEFDLQTAMDKIANITLSDDYFTSYTPLDIALETVLEDIDKSERVHFNHRGKTYRLRNSGDISLVKTDRKADKEIDFHEAITFNKLYKFVNKKDGKYYSFYDNNFEYKIGKKASAKGSLASNGWSQQGKLFFNAKETIESSSYYDRKEAVLLEAYFTNDDLVDIETDESITVTSCYVVREVPEVEWKQWTGKDVDITVW